MPGSMREYTCKESDKVDGNFLCPAVTIIRAVLYTRINLLHWPPYLEQVLADFWRL